MGKYRRVVEVLRGTRVTAVTPLSQEPPYE